MSYAFPTISGGAITPKPPLLSFPGGPLPPDPPWEGLPVPPNPLGPLGLDTDQRLTLADWVAVLHEPLDDLSRPGRGERALPAARDDGTEFRGQGHHGAG